MIDLTKRATRLAALIPTISAFAIGCATLDPAPVERARAAVTAAGANPNVGDASIDIEEARRHLALAEKALDAGRFQEDVDHQARLAGSYAQVAVVEAEANLAKEETSAFLARASRNTSVTRSEVDYAVGRAKILDAMETVRGLVLTLHGVDFAFDSADLTQEGQLAAARVAGFLIAADNREVLVEGYTDDRGTEDYNLGLSLRRAEALAAALVSNGVSATRIAADGFGPALPVASNDTDEGRAKNRRVEVTILKPGLFAAQERRAGGLPSVGAGPQ
jgi:outer membrane protein OmpA-like peptidoglycan-associated protein